MLVGLVEVRVQRYRCKTVGGTFHVKPAFCQRWLWYGTDVVGYVLVECVQKGRALDACLSALAKGGTELAVSTARRWLDAFRAHAAEYGGAVVSDVQKHRGCWPPSGLAERVGVGQGDWGVEARLLLAGLEEMYRVHHDRDGPCERMPEFWNWYVWQRFQVYLSSAGR
jgi:hypothetical protein